MLLGCSYSLFYVIDEQSRMNEPAQPEHKSGSTRVQPEAGKKPVGWAQWVVLGLGSTDPSLFFLFSFLRVQPV